MSYAVNFIYTKKQLLSFPPNCLPSVNKCLLFLPTYFQKSKDYKDYTAAKMKSDSQRAGNRSNSDTEGVISHPYEAADIFQRISQINKKAVILLTFY